MTTAPTTECPACEGQGEVVVYPRSYHARSQDDGGREVTCEECGGSGEVECEDEAAE